MAGILQHVKFCSIGIDEHFLGKVKISYVGDPVFFPHHNIGLAGNIYSCIMFTRPLYRRTPSSIYHLSDSILALFHLIWSISPLF